MPIIIRLFSPFVSAGERISIQMHSVERRFVIGLSNILSAGMYVCTFQPRNFTGCGSEGVKNICDICMCLNITIY